MFHLKVIVPLFHLSGASLPKTSTKLTSSVTLCLLCLYKKACFISKDFTYPIVANSPPSLGLLVTLSMIHVFLFIVLNQHF